MTEQVIKRGLLQTFNSATYTASVLIIEATSYVLANVPVATSVDGTSALIGANCAVLFLDAQNPSDAVILAIYGVTPVPAPARVVFVTPFIQLNNVAINSGVTNTYTLTGVTSGLPVGITGVLCRAYFGSATVGAWAAIAPHGGTIGNYFVLGNQQIANQSMNGNALLPLDSSGQIDVKANLGNCTITLYTYGYTT